MYYVRYKPTISHFDGEEYVPYPEIILEKSNPDDCEIMDSIFPGGSSEIYSERISIPYVCDEGRDYRVKQWRDLISEQQRSTKNNPRPINK